MRVFGRIVGVLLSVSLLAVGAFGLLAAYLPDGPITYDFRVALRLLLDVLPSSSLPEDAPTIVEAWLAGSLARFALVPLGGVVLVLALLPWPKRDVPLDAGDLDSPEGLPAVPRDVARQAEREAAQFVKEGQISEAAEVLFSVGLLDKAAETFIKAGELERAAEVRHQQGRIVDCAKLYIEAGKADTAGAIFAQQEDYKRAAQCYVKAGKYTVAAEMYEQAGDDRRAGDCYRDAEFLRQAAQSYVKCKAWPRAAQCLEAVYAEESVKGGATDPQKVEELKKLARQTARLYQNAQDPVKAIAVLEKGGCCREAAEIASRMRDYPKAAELFLAAGDSERAAEALRHQGKDQKADQVLGEFHRDQGDPREAAQHLEQAGDFLAAGDLYRSLEDYQRAGECYTRQDDHSQAAEMFEQAGDRGRAAESYERAGRFKQAAACYAESGSTERVAELLEKAGDFFRAGEAYHRDGRDDQAIGVLQKAEPQSEGFIGASGLLGEIFQARGQHSLAIAKLERATGCNELSRETISLYYALSACYEGNGDLAKSVETFEKVLAFDCQYGDVEQRLEAARAALQAQGPTQEAGQPANTGAVSQTSQSGRYQIQDELGRGGMGIVYRAHDTVLDRAVAYKVLPDSLKENPQALQNFLREAKAAAKLNHPNIVTVYDAGEQDGRYYIAMEYVDGTTLKEIVKRRGAVPVAGIVHVVTQVCEALAFAHDKKVVHRDIKPANMMWTRDKKAKIMDFGLARVVEEVRNHTTVVSGTPYYMSPEQTVGKNIDHRTDIYSLGVTIFEMATCTVPFKEGNIPYHHLHTPPPDIRELRPDLPEALAAIVERCLRKNPDDRYRSAREILADIRTAQG